MRIQLVRLSILIVLILNASCSNNFKSAPDEEQVFGALKKNQAKALIEIAGKEFYSNESLFEGNIHLEKNRLGLNISDQFEGQIMLGFYSPSWYKQFPVKYEVSETNRNNCRVMIGKIIDAQNRTGEGYMMSSGLIEITQLTQEKLIMKVDGKCGKYDGFELSKNLLDINGWIIFKKPNVLFLDMEWKDFQ
ncbi:hypothetical protein [Dyadobacter sp. 676]|uniref:YceI family protein n=1 Tax=Dyadobacter sp. 676 TaxID=3088362 RepID=A0AAU8FEW6_9BACT